MNINITGDNLEIDENIRELVRKEIDVKLEKHLSHFAEDLKKATVKVAQDHRGGYKANFDMWLPGKEHVFASEHHDKLITLFGKLSQAIDRQLITYLGKLSTHKVGSSH